MLSHRNSAYMDNIFSPDNILRRICTSDNIWKKVALYLSLYIGYVATCAVAGVVPFSLQISVDLLAVVLVALLSCQFPQQST